MKPNLPDGQYYKFLDFPQLPRELEQLCIGAVGDEKNLLFSLVHTVDTKPVKLMYYGNLVERKQCAFRVFKCPEPVEQWLREHNILTNDNHRVGIQQSTDGNCLLPHVDSGPNFRNPALEKIETDNYRNKAINYLLTEVGPTTCFYNSQRIDDIAESVVVPKSYWHQISTDKLHGVENVTAERISVTISLY
jgi:hypothetical protein